MRRVALRSFLFALMAGLALVVVPSTQAHAGFSSNFENDIITYTNAERVKAGRVKVGAQSCVDRYAEAQGARMAAQGRMFHQDMGAILKACKLTMVGENVAMGYTTGKTVTRAWMNSPGHKANMLNSGYRLIGVGAYKSSNGYWYVSQVFGR